MKEESLTGLLTRAERDPWLLRKLLDTHFLNRRASAAGSAVNLAIAICLFASSVPAVILAGSALAMLAILALRNFASYKLARADERIDRLLPVSRMVNLSALLTGCFWGGLTGILMPFGDTSQQFFLAILGCGMMGGGAMSFRSRFSAVRMFVLGCAPGFVFTFLALPPASAIAGLVCLFCYMVFLINFARHSASAHVESLLRLRDVEQSTATIQLLLNDFSEQGSDWLFELDESLRIARPGERFAAAVERPIEALNGTSFGSLFEPGKDLNEVLNHLIDRRAFRRLVVSLSIDGEARWWSISARPLAEAGISWRGVATDITGQRQAEEKVSYMAHFDGLTALPNRFVFGETGYRWISGDVATGLMFLDLDQFKGVNDTLGHLTGDKLLRQVAKRLSSAVHEDDLVCRLGGDEFAILVRGERVETIDEIATSIIATVSKPYEVDRHSISIGVSIGISIAPQDGADVEELSRTADLALYAAKASGRNCAMRFDPVMDEAAQQRRALEQDLRLALGENQMRLHYQPLVDIETGQPRGYEALVRWAHPERGTVMPALFIPVAEESGLIVQIGEWVIRQALEDLAKWDQNLTVSINLSPAQMRSPTLISTIINAIAQTGVDARSVCLEITETVLLQDTDANLATLHKLRGLGIRIALDDFGTGYSSFNYLRAFPFDKIKIDRSFVNEIDTRDDCLAIVRSIVALARSLGIELTAEGVERREQADLLRIEGCDEVQGFYYSKAVPASEVTDLRAMTTTIDQRLVKLDQARRAASGGLEPDGEPLKTAHKG